MKSKCLQNLEFGIFVYVYMIVLPSSWASRALNGLLPYATKVSTGLLAQSSLPVSERAHAVFMASLERGGNSGSKGQSGQEGGKND